MKITIFLAIVIQLAASTLATPTWWIKLNKFADEVAQVFDDVANFSVNKIPAHHCENRTIALKATDVPTWYWTEIRQKNINLTAAIPQKYLVLIEYRNRTDGMYTIATQVKIVRDKCTEKIHILPLLEGYFFVHSFVPHSKQTTPTSTTSTTQVTPTEATPTSTEMVPTTSTVVPSAKSNFTEAELSLLLQPTTEGTELDPSQYNIVQQSGIVYQENLDQVLETVEQVKAWYAPSNERKRLLVLLAQETRVCLEKENALAEMQRCVRAALKNFGF